MKIRIRYRHGRLQVVPDKDREEQFEESEYIDLDRIDWSTLGVDSIRSMIRGSYDTATDRRQLKK